MFPAYSEEKSLPTNNGQSLIEIIATIAIGTVLILALVALSVRSSSSSDFSKIQIQAARLASEGLEVVNYIKKSNGNVSLTNCNFVPDSSVSNWDSLFKTNVDENCTQYGLPGILFQSGSGWEIKFNSSSGETIELNKRNFTRYIYVADTPTITGGKSNCNSVAGDYNRIKQFTARVVWSDSSGSHESITTSCIKK